MTADALLRADNVSLVRTGTPLLDAVSLILRPGEIVTLIGPNGAGKTSLLRVLMGLEPPTNGRVTRRPGLRLAYLPQRFQVDRNLPLSVARFLALTRRRPARIRQALEQTGVGPLLHQPLHGVSGGEWQRVLLARCLLREPELLVLDEPAQGVDMAGQAALYRLIARLRDDTGCGVLLVSHDLHLVMAQTDTVICLNRHVCCQGSPDSVTTDPAFLQLFGEGTLDGLGVYAHAHDHRHTVHGDIVAEDRPDA